MDGGSLSPLHHKHTTGLSWRCGLRRPALMPALDEALILCIAIILTAMMTAALVLRLRGLAGLNKR